MFQFVWHLRGSVALDGESNEKTLDRVECFLEKQWKSVSERGVDSVAFDDPLWTNFFAPNWLALIIYDRGSFWIEQGLAGRRLRYDLRSLHGMAFCLFLALLFFLFGLSNFGLLDGLAFALGAFAWLYGMNVMLAVARVPSAIRKAVRPD
jgi:hypothetical protein